MKDYDYEEYMPPDAEQLIKEAEKWKHLAEDLMQKREKAVRRAIRTRQQRDAARRDQKEANLEARTSTVTGMPNRRAFEEHLQNLPGQFCLAYIDLDHMKELNAGLGHQRVDFLLARTHAYLRLQLRDYDVFHDHGDEFIALLHNCTLEKAVDVGERLRQSMQDYQHPEHPMQYLESEEREWMQKSARERQSGREGEPVVMSITQGIAHAESPEEAQRALVQANAFLLMAKEQDDRNSVYSKLKLA